MKRNNITIGSSFGWAWRICIDNVWFFFKLGLVSILCTYILPLCVWLLVGGGFGVWFFGSEEAVLRGYASAPIGLFWLKICLDLVSGLIGLWLLLGWQRIALDFYDHGSSQMKHLFSQDYLLMRGLWLSLVYVVMVGIGFLALIIPGFYALCRYFFVYVTLVDRDTGVSQTMSYTSALTYGHRMQLFLFALVSVLIGLIPFIGLTVVQLATVYVYRALQEKKNDTVIQQHEEIT